MPKEVERALKKEANEKGLKGKERDRFIYGILRHQYGWKPSREKGNKKNK